MGLFKKIWHFIWYDDSFASWIVNLILAFVLVKWVIYPGLGLLFGTSFPIVAVVSGSMEHGGLAFDDWWQRHGGWYEGRSLTTQDFLEYPFHNGFNKGDIMILRGVEPKDIKVGDVLVYESPHHLNPIIHRVVEIHDGGITFTTKGDNNLSPDSERITPHHIERTGKAVLRLPYLGWIKIGFVSLLGFG